MIAPDSRGAIANVLWIDAGNGAAGDMLLAALLDAGADLSMVRTGLAGLPLGPVELDVRQVRRYGLRALQVTVRAPDQSARRGLADITAIISQAALPAAVTAFACAGAVALGAQQARWTGPGSGQTADSSVNAAGTRSAMGRSVASS